MFGGVKLKEDLKSLKNDLLKLRIKQSYYIAANRDVSEDINREIQEVRKSIAQKMFEENMEGKRNGKH